MKLEKLAMRALEKVRFNPLNQVYVFNKDKDGSVIHSTIYTVLIP